MIETKTPWTPGNWSVSETSDGFCVGSDHDFPNSIGGSYRMYVAQFMKEPDAKLLAASPAMAEALEDCIRVLTDPIVGTINHDEPDWYAALDKAVAKANAALSLARGETA